MLRQLHSLPGLIGSLLVVVLALTGATLSINPVQERLHTTIPASGQMSVADLAGKVAAHYPNIEEIQRTPSGSIIIYFNDGNRSGVDQIDPRTGKALTVYETSSFMRWTRNLHRSFLLGTAGRVGSAAGAMLIVLLTITGTLLLAARSGGWRKILHPVCGTTGQRMHVVLGRFAVLGLLLSAMTGLYMSAGSLELIPEAPEAEAASPGNIVAGTPMPAQTLEALKAIDLNDLRGLIYPYPGNPADTYSLITNQGAGFINPSTGTLISYQAHSASRKVYELIYMLHTGEGLWWLAILLGLSALSVSVMVPTGIDIWWKRRRGLPKLADNHGPDAADTVILVGSESNTTWGFAKTLHDTLTSAGHRVHTAPMNHLATQYLKAEWMFILTATYGDGGPPASGNQFLSKLGKFNSVPQCRFAVLGFGDSQFPHFCQFAIEVDSALTAKGWAALYPVDMIDRQSPQEFARWGQNIGELIGEELTLVHNPGRPSTTRLQLAERVDFGKDVQAPTTVFRFKATQEESKPGILGNLNKFHGLPHFEAGDLVGILPPDGHVPRFYSLASSSKEGVLEICVRKQPEGLCSGYLHGLKPGETIDAFIRPNPNFRPASGKAPVILIGAGTGIGPLVGFIKHNTPLHPMYLYWGGRNPQSDFLYEPELNSYLEDHRLTQLSTAFSQVSDRAYVQDKINADAVELRNLIQNGAQILVCGGRDMAKSVREAIDEIVAPLGTSAQALKAEGRYREDVY